MHASRSREGLVCLASVVAALGCGPGARSPSNASTTAPSAEGEQLAAADAGTWVVLDSVEVSSITPDQDSNGVLDARDLEAVLVRWESGTAVQTEVNDVLALLYWRERLDEEVLLDALQRHHYGEEWSALVGALRAHALAAYTEAADGGTKEPTHSTRDSGLHQKYFSTQYDPGPGTHDAEASRNHDLYISRSWNHKESLSRLNGEPWPWGGHWNSTSATWPSNHDRNISLSFPDNHQDTVSRSWPPGHQGDNSKGWSPTDHTTSVSRGWPPNHSVSASDKGDDLHLNYTSRQYPMPHQPDVSRSHSFGISNSWPNFPQAHSTVASHTRPSNHFEAVSRSWPTDHLAVVSSNWPPNHYDEVSKQWTQNDPGVHSSAWSKIFPPDHTYFSSVKDTVGIIKDIKGVVSPKAEK